MSGFMGAHRELLDKALEAAITRGYWSAYPEMPSGRIYGETARADAEAAFKEMLGKPFALDQATSGGRVGKEASPYGFDLGITYPALTVDAAIAAAEAAAPRWADAPIDERTGVCLEILHRLNRDSFLMAMAVMHTSGQAFMMAFQAGGPHAQDRGLEAVAYAYDEMTRVPAAAVWAKPQGKAPPIVLEKTYRIVPRGIATVIGCSTFPTWNTYPGLFASLATGNAVIVKPHPGAILPLALTVRIGREVLAEAGFDPDVLLLLADEPDAPVTRDLVTDPRIGVIDFTGSPVFGRWLRENSPAPAIHTEEAGVNSIVIDGTSDFKGMCQNVAFSLSLYTGQMCTAPQNVFVPRGGIDTDDGHKSFDEVAAAIARGIDKLLADPERAAAVLGAVQNPATVARVNETAGLGRVVRPSGSVEIPGFPGARTATPLILAVDAATDAAAYTEERFGPISFIVATDDTADSISRAAAAARTRGAITAALYSTDEGTVEAAGNAFARAGVPLSVNLTGGIFVNQSAAFSDYHVTGGNPAGNACLTDSAFVANRFRVATMRRPRVA